MAVYILVYIVLYFQNCKQLEAGETTPLLKTADMNQNESAKGDRAPGQRAPLGQMLIYLYFIDFIENLIDISNWNLRTGTLGFILPPGNPE